uniref:DUF2933 domain-containing protein n=1 Tax=Pseudogulbenkiania subflava TaxID=451637 RepID=UPI00117B8673
MQKNEHVTHQDSEHSHSRGLRGSWVFWGFIAVAAFFLLSEHRAHLFGWLPFLLLLACPLMHLFMHGGHAGHGEGHDVNSNTSPRGNQGDRK